jgi:hypothetical protein
MTAHTHPSPFRKVTTLKTGPSPTAEEAAAIVAALERFMRATAPAPATDTTGPAGPDGWHAAALLEGVSRDPWGTATSDEWLSSATPG